MEKRTVEINGVKLEVDLRHATVIEKYKIGQRVKILLKKYGDDYVSSPGIIVGFDNFQQRPCIVLAYTEVSYSGADIKICYLTKDSKDVEICPMIEDELKFTKEDALSSFDKQIHKLEGDIQELKMKRSYFGEKFGQYFDFKDDQ